MKIPGIIYVGDSLMEGYGDVSSVSETVSCFGIPGRRLDRYFQTGSPVGNHINLGCSGFMVRQYLNSFYGYVNADPGCISVAIISCWTPNKPSQEPPSYSTRADVLADNLAALIECETFCLQNSIIMIPCFVFASPFALLGRQVDLKVGLDAVKTRFPQTIDLSPIVQDADVTDGPYADPDWSADATHANGDGPVGNPYGSGYSALEYQFNLDYPGALSTAKTLYQFIDE